MPDRPIHSTDPDFPTQLPQSGGRLDWLRQSWGQFAQPGMIGKAITQRIQALGHTAQGKSLFAAIRPILLVTLVTTGGLVLVRQAGGLQAWELRAYDLMVRLQPSPGLDERLLIVQITEEDIQAAQRWPLPDGIFARAIAQLQTHHPRTIGLDIYRDFPQPPGEADLHRQLQQSNVVGIRQLPTAVDPNGVAPPDMPPEQIGFNDVPLDPDSVLRRALLLTWETETGNLQYSFAYRLAEQYFRADGVLPQARPGETFGFDWGKATFQPLNANDGGYQTIADEGYSLILNYRNPKDFARTVSLAEVLEGKVNPDWIQDKIVLIGTTALSSKDFFFTPFSVNKRGGFDMPGVVVHAQMVSQLLDAVAGERPLLRVWPESGELLLIFACAGIGATLSGFLPNPLRLLILMETGAIALLLAGTWGLFLQGVWLPITAPLVALIGSSIAMISYNSSRAQREQQLLAERAAEQEQAILALRLSLSRQAEPETKIQTATSSFQRDGLVANRYRIQQVLAAGGFGITYVAKDTQRPGAPECVVKRLRPGRQDPQFLQVARRLFQAEAEILEILGRHDRIPQLLAYFEEGADFLLVEQFIRGTSLAAELPSDRRWPEDKVIALLQDLLPTLSFIHNRRIIHRDIKPNNIIRRPDGALVLIDFGAVKQMQSQNEVQTEKTIAIGTQGYAPPEQLAGHPRLNSDLYALGVIAMRALTGIPPHMLEQDEETGDLVWQGFAHCEPGLKKIVQRMAKYHFGDRYATATEVLEDLALL